MRKEKELLEKQESEKRLAEISQSLNQSSMAIQDLNLSPDKLEIVQSNIETKARSSVQEIQGQYFETVD